MTKKIINSIILLYLKYKRFFWYSVIGGSGVTLDFTAFFILTQKLGVYYQYANIISVTLGITNNFFWNTFFNFKIKDHLFKRFISFYLIGLLGLGASALLLYILIDILHVFSLIAKLLTIFIVVLIQYTLNRTISFKKYSHVE